MQFAGAVRYACTLCQDRVEAEDLVQTAFVRLLLGPPSRLEEVLQLGNLSLLKRAIYTAWIDRWRGQQAKKRQVEEILSEPVYEADYIGELDKRRLRDAAQVLPERFQSVLNLSLLGHSHVEIAGILEIPVGTVKSRAARAAARIKLILGD